MPGFLDWIANLLGDRPRAPVAPPSVLPLPATPPALAADDSRIPDASRPRVAALLATLADLDARTTVDPLLVAAQTEVRQMRDSHLPQLVKSYAEIPAAHRAEIFRRTGKSASYTLNEGLDRMIERADTLSRTLAQDNLDSFADNLRFIENRYGSRDPLA